jgi:hypothetical protein
MGHNEKSPGHMTAPAISHPAVESAVASGAGDRTRTGDVQLGKLAFYQLNYARDTATNRNEYGDSEAVS